MLQRLTIHNLALIRDLEIEFTPNLNVFSGETGAGKSIIVDSLMLLIGCRYDRSMLKFGADSGFAEGVFTYENAQPLADLGIDCEDGIFIVTRKFFRDGRNDIRINGKQITTSMLRELMQNYVDIYGQNEYQSLLKISEQRKILDHFVFKQSDASLLRQRELYEKYKSVCAELAALGDAQERSRRLDILKYQIDEIQSANVGEGEEDKLIERRHLLMSAERIKTALAECLQALDGDGGACSDLAAALRAVAPVSGFTESYASVHERLRSVSIEADDIAETIKDELDGCEDGERELDAVVARLDKLRALKAKYGSYAQMQKFLLQAKADAERAENGDRLYGQLCAERDALMSELYESCKTLSAMRRDGAKSLRKRILTELSDLGMPNSEFEAVFADMPSYDGFTDKVTASGFDEFEFYLSPNVGQPLLPLAKIISGGEMSRFMLAVKLITGDIGRIETMIFDEIDAGISGTIGLCVAKKLAQLSRTHQALCVTHLAQIAAMADGHYYIEKYEQGGDTLTRVTALERAGMIDEIARLSGTKGVSDTSGKSAAELKDYADRFKSGLE